MSEAEEIRSDDLTEAEVEEIRSDDQPVADTRRRLPRPALRLPDEPKKNWWLEPCEPEPEPACEDCVGFFVRITGDEMSGPLYLYADPTEDMMAASKHYVDEMIMAAELVEPPDDGRVYGRIHGHWWPLLDGGEF